MEKINQYVYDLSIQLLIPKGYHNLRIIKKNNINSKLYSIMINCTSKLKGINKLIPYINENFYLVYDVLVSILRDNVVINRDIIFEDYISNNREIIFVFKEIINLLNPFIISVDILSLIIKQLNVKDTNNLLLSININKYPHITKELNFKYINKNDTKVNTNENMIRL